MTAHYFEMQLCIFSGEGGRELLELHFATHYDSDESSSVNAFDFS